MMTAYFRVYCENVKCIFLLYRKFDFEKKYWLTLRLLSRKSIFSKLLFLHLKVNFSYSNIQYVDIHVWVLYLILVLQLFFINSSYDRAMICETLKVELKSIFSHSAFKSFFHGNI